MRLELFIACFSLCFIVPGCDPPPISEKVAPQTSTPNVVKHSSVSESSHLSAEIQGLLHSIQDGTASNSDTENLEPLLIQLLQSDAHSLFLVLIDFPDGKLKDWCFARIGSQITESNANIAFDHLNLFKDTQKLNVLSQYAAFSLRQGRSFEESIAIIDHYSDIPGAAHVYGHLFSSVIADRNMDLSAAFSYLPHGETRSLAFNSIAAHFFESPLRMMTFSESLDEFDKAALMVVLSGKIMQIDDYSLNSFVADLKTASIPMPLELEKCIVGRSFRNAVSKPFLEGIAEIDNIESQEVRISALNEFIRSFASNQPEEIVNNWETVAADPAMPAIARVLTRNWGLTDPKSALNWSLQTIKEDTLRSELISSGFESWLSRSPEQATLWLNEHITIRDSGELADSVVRYLISTSNYSEASAWIERVSDSERKRALQSLLPKE